MACGGLSVYGAQVLWEVVRELEVNFDEGMIWSSDYAWIAWRRETMHHGSSYGEWRMEVLLYIWLILLIPPQLYINIPHTSLQLHSTQGAVTTTCSLLTSQLLVLSLLGVVQTRFAAAWVLFRQLIGHFHAPHFLHPRSK